MKNQKGYILPIIIILVVLTSFIGIYYLGTIKSKSISLKLPTNPPNTSLILEPSEELTSNWETYVNNKYNFTIKYPNDFKMDEYAEGVYVTLYKGTKIDSPPMDPYGKSLSITLAFRTDLSDPDAACNEYETGIIGQCSSFDNIGVKYAKEKVAINGSIGVYVQKDDNTGKTYYLKKIDGNRVVEISLWKGDLIFPENETELLNQILSTFKFIN